MSCHREVSLRSSARPQPCIAPEGYLGLPAHLRPLHEAVVRRACVVLLASPALSFHRTLPIVRVPCARQPPHRMRRICSRARTGSPSDASTCGRGPQGTAADWMRQVDEVCCSATRTIVRRSRPERRGKWLLSKMEMSRWRWMRSRGCSGLPRGRRAWCSGWTETRTTASSLWKGKRRKPSGGMHRPARMRFRYGSPFQAKSAFFCMYP